jgi:hypothetical protein
VVPAAAEDDLAVQVVAVVLVAYLIPDRIPFEVPTSRIEQPHAV